MLGGIITPKHPLAAINAAEKFLEYPLSTIAGNIIDPTATTVAGADPDIAPKKAHVTMVTIANPPVTCPTKLSATLTSLWDNPPPTINAPDSMKKGIAISGKEFKEVNIFVAMKDIGMKSVSPIKVIMLSPIAIPIGRFSIINKAKLPKIINAFIIAPSPQSFLP
jgi:hypothetical protein